jgi:TatD DNase family protein
VELTDTHCHLYFDTYDQDLDQVIQRAEETGVGRILVPAIDLETSREALRLVERYQLVFAAVGVHPNSGMTWKHDTLVELRDLAAHSRVVAIGEIGLDYYRQHAPQELQRKILEDQLSLAADLDLPVILHVRNQSDELRSCMEDLLGMLESWQQALPGRGKGQRIRGVVHSFSGNPNESRRALKAGFLLGINGAITFKNAELLREVVSQTGLEKILIETDGPFITPHPFRGKRNEPAHVRYIVDKISEVKGIDPSRVAEQTAVNAKQIFKWE